MFRDFVINAGMLVAFLSLCYQIFGSTGLNHKLPMQLKIKAGFIFGIMGIILVEFSVKITNNLIIDLRILPILIASIYGGFIPGIFSSLIIAVFRLLRFGFSEAAVFAAISVLLLPVLTYPLFRKQQPLHKKWIYGLILSEAFVSIAYVIFIPEPLYRYLIIFLFCSVSTVVAFALYHYVGYLEAYTFAFIRYKQEAKRDFLTGLNNVRQFDTVYNTVIKSAEVSQKKISLVFLDIDFFKKVNDTYGHKEGDNVLRILGDILRQNCREMDIISRNGGEEFSVILPDCEHALAEDIAERLRLKVQNTPFLLSDGTKINITISLGIASFPDKVSDLHVLKEKADEALYTAKRSGRNRVVSIE